MESNQEVIRATRDPRAHAALLLQNHSPLDEWLCYWEDVGLSPPPSSSLCPPNAKELFHVNYSSPSHSYRSHSSTSGYHLRTPPRSASRARARTEVFLSKGTFLGIAGVCVQSNDSFSERSSGSARKKLLPQTFFRLVTILALRVACHIHAQSPESRTRYVLVLAKRDLLRLPWHLLLVMSQKSL